MLVPSYLSVRFGENENLIKSRLRTFYEANELYRKTHRPPEYPKSLEALSETMPPLVEKEFLKSPQAGYRFIYDRMEGSKFTVTAKPIFKFLTGYRTFFVDETGIIRLNNAMGDPIDA